MIIAVKVFLLLAAVATIVIAALLSGMVLLGRHGGDPKDVRRAKRAWQVAGGMWVGWVIFVVVF